MGTGLYARRSWIGLWENALSHLLPACFFAALLTWRSVGLVVRSRHGDISQLLLGRELVSIVFLAEIVVLYMLRRPLVGGRAPMVASSIALGGTFLLSLPLPVGTRTAQAGWAVVVSDVLILMGTAFSILSLTYLGRCFGIKPEARGLVTSGPYRWVRHPLYLGEITFCLGWVIARGSLAAVAAFTLFCCLQYYRALMEEAVLESTFPEYADYRLRTYRLIPLVH